MKRSFTYLRNTLTKFYSEYETEAFISIIFNHIYNYSRREIILHADKILSDDEFEEIKKIAQRLTEHEPIQYILGKSDFYDLKFNVNHSVLIPRNETEELVDLIIKKNKNRKFKLLDIGTGSGCIPIAIKKNILQAEVYSCDISEEALQIAQKNAAINQADITFFKHDILSDQKLPYTDFDLIVSNPPYVTEREKELMDDNVLLNEPHLALFVPNNDPLRFYSSIVKQATKNLNRDGELYFEINEAYGKEVVELLNRHNFSAELISDINGKDRMVYGQKKTQAI